MIYGWVEETKFVISYEMKDDCFLLLFGDGHGEGGSGRCFLAMMWLNEIMTYLIFESHKVTRGIKLIDGGGHLLFASWFNHHHLKGKHIIE